ncbi:MAG: uroporphyrinogen-III synthase [Rhodospirillales bacterium]
MKPVVLVTRPAEEALRTAMALAEHGYEFLIEPLLEIAPLPDAEAKVAGAGQAAALLFTSANGVRAYAGATPARELPVFAVGGITADAARAAGFQKVAVAAGDVEALADLAARELTPGVGRLLHVAGEHVAGDLAGRLGAKGFDVHTLALYAAKAATSLSPKARDTLARGGLGAVLFFSPRTARTFVSLVRTAGLDAYCRACMAVCLSPAVAEAAGALAWRKIETAARPGEGPAEGSSIGAMIDALMRVLPSQGREPAGERSTMAETDKKTIALPAGEVIQRFGGIRPMAAKLGISFSTVQGWKERGHIPEPRHGEILALAATHGIALEAPAASPEPPTAARPGPPPGFRQTAAPQAADKPPPMPPPLVHQPVPPPRAPAGLGVLGAAVVSLAIVAAAFAGAYYTRDRWLGEIAAVPMPAPAQPSVDKAALDALVQRLAKAERDLAARPAGGGAPAADAKLGEDIAALDRRLTELQNALYAAREQAKRDSQAATATLSEVTQAAKAGAAEQAKATAALGQRVEALEKGFDPAAFIAIRNSLNDLAAKLDALGKRMAEAERIAASARAEGLAQAALALSVGQIRRAIDAGSPFAAELAAGRSLAGGDAALAGPLDLLAPLAATGIATRAALTQSYKDTAAAIVHAARARDGESGAWRRFVAWLDSLITVRPIGAAAGDSPAARAARAEALLAAGDLAGAVAQLDALGAPASNAARPWLDRAKARLQAEQALAALETRAAAAMARK